MSTNATAINLPLNSNATGYIPAGSEVVYSFTATTTGLYTLETFGSTDTFGIVTVNGNSYVDNDSGKNTNFAIGFNQSANTTATIRVMHNDMTNGSGQFSIQVRQQKARIYTNVECINLYDSSNVDYETLTLTLNFDYGGAVYE